MRRSVWLSGLFALALLGCSDDTVTPAPDTRARDVGILGDRPAGEVSLADRGTGEAQGTTLSATLTGAQEVPPVTTSATGSASATLNAAKTQISVTVTYTGLTNITAAHIHVGAAGVDGPVIFTLAAGTFTSPLNKTLAAADLTPQAAQNINTFAEAVTALLAGNTYVNIHTTQYPDGEIRGQLMP